MSGCPTEEQLAGYAAGALARDEKDRLRAHVAECASCAKWVAEANADEALLASVRAVLRKQVGGAGWSRPARDPNDLAAAFQQPFIIEGFDIEEEIGRGGMGLVYRARQKDPPRTVALKVLLDGEFASETAKRRFEREVELTAQLQHPNIVTVLESGIASARFFYTMPYVKGRRLDEYATGKALSVRQRLQLFELICRAVNYAHQHGIIHRDLKPSNILIDNQDAPKILDFGLAKTADANGTAASESLLLSVTGQVMGTLPYMSPEQATATHRNVDARTDVYALGVILYELLTGQYPYPVVGQMADALKNIAEAEPRRPSTIARRIDNDLETIILKALCKDAERRYQTPGDFARDIDNYLKGRPIDARRASYLYILRKAAKRHAYASAVLATVSIALISLAAIGADLLMSTFGIVRERDQIQQKKQELTDLGGAARDIMRTQSLGWFLLAWHADHIELARKIQASTDGPESSVMAFLIDGNYPARDLLLKLRDHESLAYFAIGERLVRSGDLPSAVPAFRVAADSSNNRWVVDAARAWLNELRDLRNDSQSGGKNLASNGERHAQ